MRKTAVNRKSVKGREYGELLDKYNLLLYLMDHIPDVIYFKDKKGRLISVNRAHAEGFGLKPKDVIGKTDFDLFPKIKAEKMAKDDMYVLKTGKPIIDKIERATSPGGSDNYVSTTKIPKLDGEGAVVGLVGITRDVTRRMQYEQLKERHSRVQRRLEILEEMSRMKSDLVSSVSHEIRTPLAIIKQLVMQLSGDAGGPVNERQKEIIEKTQDNIERLGKIIDELLDVSRIERGRFKLEYSLVDLKGLIAHSRDYFQKTARKKGIALDYLLPGHPVNLFVDVERINQAIYNLIDNAVKFTEQGGNIKVELKVLDTKVRIGVVDTGIGISRAHLAGLFKKFRQAPDIAGYGKKGIGLGLSLTKETVERHGGEIWAESKPGIGSKFYFNLPRYYIPDALDNKIIRRINHLLKKKVPLCVVNLQIADYKVAKKDKKTGGRRFFKNLEVIIKEVIRDEGRGRKRANIVIVDTKDGRYSVVFPGSTEERANRLASLFDDKIRAYFDKNRIKGVFISLGILSFPQEDEARLVEHLPAKVYVKKIMIGLEKRRSRRISYRIDINLSLPKNITGTAQTVNISEDGICLITNKLLETDSPVGIAMTLPGSGKTVHIRGRVAWIKKMRRMPKEKSDRYQIGLETVGLKDGDRKLLHHFLISSE